jgi:3-dehydroquinate synthase
MNRIYEVELGERSYEIHLGPGLLSKIGELLSTLKVGKRVMIISNTTVAPLYQDVCLDSLEKSGFIPAIACMPDGEQYKNIEEANKFYEPLLDNRMDRNSAVIALGGGVVGDLTGLVAASYMRGVPFIQVPTTLLAQVDSSIGGKVAVNHPRSKNLIGFFYQPLMVLTDINTLRTLPEREFRAGMAEIIKHGMIRDEGHCTYLLENAGKIKGLDEETLVNVIMHSCGIKGAVVAEDEREGGIRAILNFGHTVGHAIESIAGYGTFLHGEAVAFGMLAETRIARALGLCGDDAEKWLATLLDAYGFDREFPKLDLEELLKAMTADKKVLESRIKFVLPVACGEVAIRDDVPMELVTEVLADMIG